MTELVVILSSFNRATLLKEALHSIAAALSKLNHGSAIFVVDAGSRDGSQEIVNHFTIKTPVPIHLLERPGISFAAGVNEAARHAAAVCPESRYILLFETDNFVASEAPLKDALTLLAKQSHLGAAGFTVRRHDGLPAGFGCAKPSFLQFALGPQFSFHSKLDRPSLKWRRDHDTNWSLCDIVYTSPLLVRRDAWELSKGFDAETFPFSDCDLDWALRMRQIGFSQAVIQTTEVIHDNQQFLSSWSATRALHYHRARFQLLRKNHGGAINLAIPLLALRHFCELTVALVGFRSVSAYAARVKKRWTLLTHCFCSYR